MKMTIKFINNTSKPVGMIFPSDSTYIYRDGNDGHTFARGDSHHVDDSDGIGVIIGDYNYSTGDLSQYIKLDLSKFSQYTNSDGNLAIIIVDECNGFMAYDDGHHGLSYETFTSSSSTPLLQSNIYQQNGDVGIYLSYNPPFFVKASYNGTSLTFSQFNGSAAVMTTTPSVSSTDSCPVIKMPGVDTVKRYVQKNYPDVYKQYLAGASGGGSGSAQTASSSSSAFRIVVIIILGFIIGVIIVAAIGYVIKHRKKGGAVYN